MKDSPNIESQVIDLVNAALEEENTATAVKHLRRARKFQPTGRLPTSRAIPPKIFYARRRALILARLEAGRDEGRLPTITELAHEFDCSLSVVHGLKREFESKYVVRRPG